MMCILRVVLLLIFVSDAWCQSDSYMFYSDYRENAVYRLDLDTGKRTTLPITGLVNPLSVDYDPTTDYLYIANVRLHTNNVTKFFLKYHLTTGRTETYYIPRSYLISAMALDPVSQLIYYGERSAQVIIALTTDFKYETVIINEALIKPSSLVLDVARLHMYWCDWSKTSPQIGKANMHGTNQQRLIVSHLQEPYALALDVKENWLYWSDNGPNRTLIEMSKTDGRQRQTLVHLNKGDFVMSIAIDDNYVYWTLSRRGLIHRTQKYKPHKTDAIGDQYSNTTDFRSLRLVKKSPSPTDTNVCGLPGRGGCQHVCIPTFQSRVCQCAEGHVLQSDGTSCREGSFIRGLVTTDVNRRALLVHDLDTDVTKKLTDRWHEHDNPLDVVYDNITEEVYWQDRFRNGIYKACIQKPCYKQVREYREKESQMTAMALDTGKKMIYICDFGLKKLSRLSYSGTQEDMLVTNLTTYITSMALDTHRRHMYWANVRSSIEVADMDTGTGRKVILPMAGVYISGMEIDSQAGLLYILDYTNNRLQVYDLNKSSKPKTIYQTNGTESLYGLTIGDGTLYFSDRDRQSIHELDLKTNQTIEYGRRSYKRVVGMTYFNFGPTRKPSDIYHPRGPVVAAVSGNSLQNLTLIIAVSVAVGGLIIIILIIICGVVIYKKTSTSVEPEPAPPTNPPVPLNVMVVNSQQLEPPLGAYATLFCEPDEDEPKKQPLPPDASDTSYQTAIPVPVPLPAEQPPPYQRY